MVLLSHNDRVGRLVYSQLDPNPAEWLNASKRKRLENDLGAARSTLAIGGLLPRAINLWLRQRVSEEAPWSVSEREQVVSGLESAWREGANIDSKGLLDAEVSFKLSVSPGCEAWAHGHWAHRLETLFLSKKALLDRASCRLLRVSNKGLSLELYHSIKAGEQSFANTATLYGEGPERLSAGLIPLQPLSSMPLGLAKVLPNMKPKELLQPRRLGNFFAVVQLETWSPARFDSKCRQLLINAELDQWLDLVGALALSHLMCCDQIDIVVP